jgi:magnesium transporter
VTARTVLRLESPPFTWLDLVHPGREELADVARRYALHATSVQDCLDPEHLPKYERIRGTTFLIVRAIDANAARDCASVQEMTRKVAVFYGPDFLITIHRTEQPFLQQLEEEYRGRAAEHHGTGEAAHLLLPHLLSDLINGAIATYEKPLEEAETALDAFERTVFGEHELTNLLRGIYQQKRRVALMKRMLRHTLDVIQKIVPASEPSAPLYQDLQENAQSMHFYADELLDDVNNLLSMHIALAAHRTNEVVRVLTIFSVFFLPLTFIVGVYGMNFRFMPELQHPWGYPVVLGAMGIVTLAIYLWFRSRGWLR